MNGAPTLSPRAANAGNDVRNGSRIPRTRRYANVDSRLRLPRRSDRRPAPRCYRSASHRWGSDTRVGGSRRHQCPLAPRHRSPHRLARSASGARSHLHQSSKPVLVIQAALARAAEQESNRRRKRRGQQRARRRQSKAARIFSSRAVFSTPIQGTFRAEGRKITLPLHHAATTSNRRAD